MNRNDMQAYISWLPEWAAVYAVQHANTIPKLMQNIVWVMIVCNAFFLMRSWGSSLPYMGISTSFISYLLISQNSLIWIVLNNSNAGPSFRALAPSDFTIGLSAGTSVGASILSFVVSVYYGHLSKCEANQEYMSFSGCKYNRGTMSGLWFWGGLLFWLNAAMALLLIVGKDELLSMQQGAYDAVDGMEMNNYDDPTTGTTLSGHNTTSQQGYQQRQPQQQAPPQPQQQRTETESITFEPVLVNSPAGGAYQTIV